MPAARRHTVEGQALLGDVELNGLSMPVLVGGQIPVDLDVESVSARVSFIRSVSGYVQARSLAHPPRVDIEVGLFGCDPPDVADGVILPVGQAEQDLFSLHLPSVPADTRVNAAERDLSCCVHRCRIPI